MVLRKILFLVFFFLSFMPLSYASSYNDAKKAYDQHDYTKAFSILKILAEGGDANAQISLGTLYYYGVGVKQDRAKSIALWQPLADKGNVHGEYCMGGVYYLGHGVKQDSEKALEYFRKAADQGFARAQLEMCGAYFNGIGTKVNWPEAIKWCRKAADQGDGISQIYMANIYQKGYGVKKDDAEAYFWYSLGLKSSSQKLTADKREQADKRIKEWKPSVTSATEDWEEKYLVPPQNTKDP